MSWKFLYPDMIKDNSLVELTDKWFNDITVFFQTHNFGDGEVETEIIFPNKFLVMCVSRNLTSDKISSFIVAPIYAEHAKHIDMMNYRYNIAHFSSLESVIKNVISY